MPYVASTLSNDQNYTVWNTPPNEGSKIARPATAVKRIFIAGRANVANKLTTPEGVITAVTEEEVVLLKTNPVFKIHEANGHVKIIARQADPAKVAKDMTARDDSAQLNAAKGDFEIGGRAAGVAPKNSKVE
jgi:hypothetical protein